MLDPARERQSAVAPSQVGQLSASMELEMHLNVAAPGRKGSWNASRERFCSGFTCSECEQEVTEIAWASSNCRWLMEQRLPAVGGSKVAAFCYRLKGRCAMA